MTYPALTADAAPAWTSEAAAITPSDPTFAPVVATPRKLAALTQVSNEVLDDSDPPLVGVLNDHLMKVLALKLDAGLLEGTGTPPEPTGLKNITGKQTLAAATNGQAPTFDNSADAIALLEGVNVPRERMRIVAHPRNLSTLRKAKASTAGSYLWQDVGNAQPATVFGVPIVASPQLATNESKARRVRSPTARTCTTPRALSTSGGRRSRSRSTARGCSTQTSLSSGPSCVPTSSRPRRPESSG